MWRCGDPKCERPEDIGWHARTVEHIEDTEGPTAAREFERKHPELDD